MERDFRLSWQLLVEEAIRRRHSLKLTQKQLSSLAGVSTPTISRFEQNDEDIQLSSVLAILGVLGMTDKRNLIFPDQDYRDGFGIGVIFWGQDGEKRPSGNPPVYAISAVALQGTFLESGPQYDFYHGFLKIKPIDVLDGTIYLYDRAPPR